MEKSERVEQQDLERLKNMFITKTQKPKDNKKLSSKQQKFVMAQSDNQENESVIQMLKAPPILINANETILNINGVNDTRKLCLTPNKYPFSAIGVLHASFNAKYNGYGTAFIIKQNTVLTAAHNVYRRQTQIQAKCIHLLFNMQQNKAEEFLGCIAYLPKQYKQTVDQNYAREYDFAIIILNSKISQKFGIIPLSSEINQKEEIQIQGFPDDLSQQKFTQQSIKFQKNETTKIPQRKHMFGSTNKISELSQRNIYHLIDTTQGQSGSPILRQIAGKKHAIGVHTAGNQQRNWGVRITTEVTGRMGKWIQSFCKEQKTEEEICLFNKSGEKVIPFRDAAIKKNQNKRIAITPDKACMGLKDGSWLIDNTNSNVCIYNYGHNWLCSSALSFDDEFVFTIKVIKLAFPFIYIGVMEEEKKGEEWDDTMKQSVFLQPYTQQIRRPNEEQTSWQYIECSCSSPLLKFPFQIECHVNRQQNTIAWHYDGKQQAKSTLPKAWKTHKKQLCAIVDIYNKGDCVQMM